mmetsp:Transcript_39785/g.38339  ORF Transcript_39785/g.38339 Transcript_39785/m.38339 type:complete len:138 (+) Transcript_39785:636-1049(+)
MQTHLIQDNFLKSFKERIGYRDINKTFESNRPHRPVDAMYFQPKGPEKISLNEEETMMLRFFQNKYQQVQKDITYVQQGNAYNEAIDFDQQQKQIYKLRNAKILIGFFQRIIHNNEYQKLSEDMNELKQLMEVYPEF